MALCLEKVSFRWESWSSVCFWCWLTALGLVVQSDDLRLVSPDNMFILLRAPSAPFRLNYCCNGDKSPTLQGEKQWTVHQPFITLCVAAVSLSSIIVFNEQISSQDTYTIIIDCARKYQECCSCCKKKTPHEWSGICKTWALKVPLWNIRCSPLICRKWASLYTDSAGSLVTDRKSAHWDSYQWKLFKACGGACTVSHPSGRFPWQLLPSSTCRLWQPSERSPRSLKYHWQGQHPAGGKPLKHHVRFQRCGAREAQSLRWRWSKMTWGSLWLPFSFVTLEVNDVKLQLKWMNTVWEPQCQCANICAGSNSFGGHWMISVSLLEEVLSNLFSILRQVL